MDRRKFLVHAGVAATAGAIAASCGVRRSAVSGGADEWDQVREQFNLARDQIDLSALFITSHPKTVGDAVDRYRPREIGKNKIATRTHELNRQFKEGLAGMSHVKLYTPRDENLSSGIVCFDINGMSPREEVGRLRPRNTVATPTPYAQSHARVSPSIRNLSREIETGLREIHALA